MRNKLKDICILIIPLAICAIVYPFLPEQIPRQFHLDGTKSYMSKNFIFLIGLIPFIIYLWKKKK